MAGQRRQVIRRALAALAAAVLAAGTGEVDGLEGQEPDSASRAPADSAVRSLPEITVRAARPVATGGVASAVELAADSAAAPPAPTLDELLREMPLLRVRTNSRGQVQPSLRGMEERQLAILLDGVPLTVGWDDRTDLSTVPLQGARRVTLVRGLSSVLAGPNVLGGYVQVDLAGGRAGGGAPRAGGETAVDGQGAVEMEADAGFRTATGAATLEVRAGAGYRDRPGLARPGGLSAPPAGDPALLPNTRRVAASAFGSARLEGEDGWWTALSAVAFGARRGVLPELHLLAPGEPGPRYWRIPDQRRTVLALSAGSGERATPLGRGGVRASLGLDLQHLEVDAYGSLAYADSVGGETGDDRTVSARLEAFHALGAGEARAAVTLADTRHEEVLDPAVRAVYRQRLWSAGAELEQPLSGGSGGGSARPSLTLGASVDGASTPRTGGFPSQPPVRGWGGRVAASVLVAGGAARVHGGMSRKVRFASLRELYSGALGKFEPNPDLGPETLWVAEAGLTAHPAGQDVQLTVFQQRLQGSIVRAATASGAFRRENRGETRSTGVEAVAGLTLGPVSLEADVTLQRVRLVGAEPGERPEYQPAAAAGARADVRLPAGFRAELAADVTGRQHGVDPRLGRAVALDPSVWLAAGLRREFRLPLGRGRRAEVRVDVLNPTDAIVWEQLGLPRPGRTLRLGLALR